jgi:transposase
MLGGGLVKQVYELAGAGQSIRQIARTLGIARNSVRKYLRAAEIPHPPPRRPRSSKLDPYQAYVRQRVAEGVDNCVVLLRELQAQGYPGGYSILKDFVQPLRRRTPVRATRRFETAPGEQAQVDFGHFRYQTVEGTTRSLYGFVLVLSWSRAMYVAFVRRADVATFLRCHVDAFTQLGGIPQRCLYDNTKVVVLGRDAAGRPVWNPQFLDFARRLGFDPRLCAPYRAQTKGRVESGIKYVRRNFWPTARFVDEADLNRQVQAWVDAVAHQRLHGTTREQPGARLPVEHPHLHALPARERVVPFLRESRQVGRDGYVQWEQSWYGVPWTWAGKTVHVQATATTVQIWADDQRLAVHPRASQPGHRFTLPGQWAGLPYGAARARPEPLAVQLPTVAVQHRSLTVYARLAEGPDAPVGAAVATATQVGGAR